MKSLELSNGLMLPYVEQGDPFGLRPKEGMVTRSALRQATARAILPRTWWPLPGVLAPEYGTHAI